MQSDSRIFREVNALSRLSHRFIVRYYTTWVETLERASPTVSDSDDSDREMTSVGGTTSMVNAKAKRRGASDGISFDLVDLDAMGSDSKSSFPSIHFSRSSSPKTDEESDSDDGFGDLFGSEQLETPSNFRPVTPPPRVFRTLYIQMVRNFVIRAQKMWSNGNLGICRASNSERGQ
jgi:eukaryotic translation initiation factor 2-alpha kinase 4